jgi:hypothetical protein
MRPLRSPAIAVAIAAVGSPASGVVGMKKVATTTAT